MFCPKCGQRDDVNSKFCRGCGENLKAVSKAMEPRWRKWLYRKLDSYIRQRQSKLSVAAGNFRKFRWFWLMLIGFYLAEGVFSGNKEWWEMDSWFMALFFSFSLLTGYWDYVSYRRLSASGSSDNKAPAQPARLPDPAVELSSAPTTNELAIPTTKELAPRFSVTESTTRQLEPLTAAKKRSGDLL